MERRYRARLDELLDDAEVHPGLLRGLLPRLETFLEPFVESLCCPEQRTNARHYVSGLLSDLKSKDAESIAYLFDRERQGLQKFIGQAPTGTTSPWSPSWPARSASAWAKPVACWSSTPPPSSSRARSPSACSASGAAGSARSRTARSASTSATSPTRATPWSITASTCPRSGPRIAQAA